MDTSCSAFTRVKALIEGLFEFTLLQSPLREYMLLIYDVQLADPGRICRNIQNLRKSERRRKYTKMVIDQRVA